jgi:hypothetical protein
MLAGPWKGVVMNVLEVAIYAMVLAFARPAPFECVSVRPTGVNCTNGLAAQPFENNGLSYSNGVVVLKDSHGRVSLSNGISTYYDSSAWVTFKEKNGDTVIQARRIAPMRFKFSNGFICEATGKETDMARCFLP